MSISETITLVDGVSGPAKAAATALGGIASALLRIKSTSAGLGDIAGEVEKISKAAAAGGIDKINAKGAADQLLASQKAAAAEKAAADKAAAASSLAAQKAAAAAGLADQKAAAADAMARNKAIADLIKQQAADAGEVAKVQAKGAADAEKIQAKIAKEVAGSTSGSGGGAGAAGGAKGEDTEVSGTIGSIVDAVKELGPVGDIIMAVVAALTAAGVVMADLIDKGAQLAVKAGTFRENTIIGFQALLGTEKAASDLYEKALDLSDRIGIDQGKVVTDLNKFIMAGMSEKDALKAVEAIGDVTAVNEAAGTKLAAAFTKMQASGKFDKSSLKGLERMGVSDAAIIAALEKSTKKSKSEILLALKAGTIDAATGMAAVEEVIDAKLGKLATKTGQSIERKLGDIQAEFVRLFDQITSGAGGDAIKKLLGAISDGLTGEGGAALKDALNELFGNLGVMFGEMFGKSDVTGTMKSVAAVIKDIGGFVKEITPGVQGFVRGLVDGFKQWSGPMSTVLDAFMSLFGLLGSNRSVWETIGRGIGFLIGFFVTLAEVIVGVVSAIVTLGAAFVAGFFAILGLWSEFLSWLGDLFSSIYDSITGAGDSMQSAANEAGSSMIDGLVDGIESNAEAVITAVIETASSAIKAAEKILGIASPSKVFHGIGANVSKGAELGITAGIPGVENAAYAMGGAAIGAANDNAGVRPGSAQGAGGAGAGGHGGLPPIQINVTVQGGTTNSETSDAVAEGTERGVVQALRKLGSLRAA
jgi:hypothetical protein